MKRIATGVALFLSTMALAGCGESFTFEAVPSGMDEDSAETGLEGDPTGYDCFTIEADSSSGDDGDQQLGEFCKVDSPSDDAQFDMDDEQDEDD